MAEPSSTYNQPNQHIATQHNNAGPVYYAAPATPPRRFAAVPPAPPETLVGRDALLAELVHGLTAGQARALSTDGQGGAGKTALALAVAYHPAITAHFTGGVLWAGLGPHGSPTNAIGLWADALEVEVSHLPTLDQRRDRIVQALDDRPTLVVLDDLWDLQAASALRLSRPNIVHLLTTRDASLARAFAGPANQRHVPSLDEDPAFALLAALAPKACAADPIAARHLVQAVGGLPLALVLLGGYLAATGSQHFATQQRAALHRAGDPATRLALACARLGAADAGDVPLADVIALSLHDLPAPVCAAFYALGAFAPKPATLDVAAARAVTGADEASLGALLDRNLLELDEAERLAVHQVVADMARRETPEEALAAHDGYYLGVVEADEEDWQRIEGEYDQAQHAMQRLDPTDARLVAWSLALFTYWLRRGLGADGLRWTERALTVAEAGGDLATQGKLRNNLGEFYYARSEYPPAMDVHRRALDLYRQAGDAQGEAEALHGIGLVYSTLGDQQQALDYYDQALPLLRQVGDKRGEATTLNNIGGFYSALGDKQQALDYYNQALPLRRQVGDKAGEAATLTNIGAVYSALGDQQQALDYFNQALPLQRQVGDKAGEAATLGNIGRVYSTLGDKQQALDYYNQALPLQRQVGDKAGEAATRFNIAMAAATLGDLDCAVAELEQVVALDEAIHHPDLESDRAELARIRARRDAGW